jgi:hypothetical protein
MLPAISTAVLFTNKNTEPLQSLLTMLPVSLSQEREQEI